MTLNIIEIAEANNQKIHSLEKEILDLYLRMEESNVELIGVDLKWMLSKIADIKLNNKILGGLNR